VEEAMKQPTKDLKSKQDQIYKGEFFQTHPVNEHRMNDLCLLVKEIRNDKINCFNIEQELTQKDIKKVKKFRM
jgi:predicted Zn-dependent protease